MLRSCINVGANARDGAVRGFKSSDPKVSDLHGFAIRCQQKILWFDVTMNHPTLVRVGEAGANLL